MTSTADNNDVADMEALYRRIIADDPSLTQAETDLYYRWLLSSPTMTSTTNNNDNDATEMEALYRRAIADASSLTQAEINQIFDWCSPEEDERICRTKANGKTRAELIAIAATHPEQLTRVESELVQRSRNLLADFRREEQHPNQPPSGLNYMMELIDRVEDAARAANTPNPLHDEAYQAVWNALDDQERIAIDAAKNRLFQIMDEEKAEDDRQYALRMQQAKEEAIKLGFSRD